MHSVLVLMSTYNGEKFLNEQLESLYNQRGVDLHILVRDDGSKDSTLSILDKFKSTRGQMTIIKGQNVGAAKSFFEVAHYAKENLPQYDYYSFCDQDDVWLPDKLSGAVSALEKYDESNKLYFCRSKFVDTNLNFIKESDDIKPFDYTTCVYRNPALGCTMVFDKKLFILFCLANRKLNEIVCLHDAWLFKCAVFTDSIIIADRNIYINYRQHGNNVTMANKSVFKKYYSAFKRRFKRKKYYRKSVETFYEVYGGIIQSPEKKIFLQTLISYNKSILHAVKYLRVQPWKTENLLDKLLWDLLVLIKLY